ncbi:MAG TPA: lecithin retinol acyltransferase family protein [Puia sp.]|nr:lecithin retinol acyltransferase family protein [Puia sp.]
MINQGGFIEQTGLQTGDRLIRQKGPFSSHHVIFVQTSNGPLVAENQAGKGVQYVTLEDFLRNAGTGTIQIQKFSGTEADRQAVISRINALIGTSYNLVNFNCEHFAELIQTGVAVSKQVGAAVLSALLIGICLAIAGGRKRR